jgi:hypothetical protein
VKFKFKLNFIIRFSKKDLPVVDGLAVDVFGDKGRVDGGPVDDLEELDQEVFATGQVRVHPGDNELKDELLRQRPGLLH